MTQAHDIAENGEARVRAAVDAAIHRAILTVDLDALEAALESSDDAAIKVALGIAGDTSLPLLEPLDDDNGGYGAAIVFLLLSGGGLAANAHNFKLNMFSPQVQRWTRTIIGDFARQFSKDTATAALETIARHQARGLDSKAIGIRATRALNLTPRQAASLDAYEAALSDLLTSPVRIRTRVGNETRIPHSAVQRAIARHAEHLSASQRTTLRKVMGTEFTPDDVEAQVEREARAMRRYRLDVIARQESLRAVHAGQQAGFEQGVSDGAIPAIARRHWITAGDERVRHSHAAIPAMNAAGVGITDSFTTPFGPVMIPPLEINCRCQVRLDAVR